MSYKGISGASALRPSEYLRQRILAYLDNYNLIYAKDNEIKFDAMPIYKKLPIPVGFAKSAEIFPGGTQIIVRTLEGDVDTVSSDGIYLMIGIQGEVYPILKENFERDYSPEDVPYTKEAEYVPAILNRITGERQEILPYARTCVPRNTKLVRAQPVDKSTKVFSYWDTEKYFYGNAGDFLVANEGAYDDCYIVRRDIFEKSYGSLN
jgi:phosphoglycolate phosphatase